MILTSKTWKKIHRKWWIWISNTTYVFWGFFLQLLYFTENTEKFLTGDRDWLTFPYFPKKFLRKSSSTLGRPPMKIFLSLSPPPPPPPPPPSLCPLPPPSFGPYTINHMWNTKCFSRQKQIKTHLSHISINACTTKFKIVFTILITESINHIIYKDENFKFIAIKCSEYTEKISDI